MITLDEFCTSSALRPGLCSFLLHRGFSAARRQQTAGTAAQPLPQPGSASQQKAPCGTYLAWSLDRLMPSGTALCGSVSQRALQVTKGLKTQSYNQNVRSPKQLQLRKTNEQDERAVQKPTSCLSSPTAARAPLAAWSEPTAVLRSRGVSGKKDQTWAGDGV